MAYLNTLQSLYQLRNHRICRQFKLLTIILNPQQVTAPSGNCQRNGSQLLCIAVFCYIGFDGFAVADAYLLRGIGCNTLGRIRHKGIGNPDINYFIYKCLRRQDSRIGNNRHTLNRTNLMNQLVQLFVLHLIGNQIISQNTAINCQSCMQRIQTGSNLHAFYLIYSVAICHINACFFQSRTAIGEFVLDNQVLGTFCVYKRSDIGFLGGNNRSHTLNPCLFQLFTYRISRSWGDLINHTPGECNLLFIAEIVHKFSRHEALLLPFFCHSYDGILQLLTIM